MNATPTPPFDPQIAVLPGGEPGGSQGAADRRSRRLRAFRRAMVLALAVALVMLGSWFLTAQSGPATLRRLPPEERAALAERTLSNLRDICRNDDRPRDFCREQASLLLELPECGEACRAQARDELTADTAVR